VSFKKEYGKKKLFYAKRKRGRVKIKKKKKPKTRNVCMEIATDHATHKGEWHPTMPPSKKHGWEKPRTRNTKQKRKRVDLKK